MEPRIPDGCGNEPPMTGSLPQPSAGQPGLSAAGVWLAFRGQPGPSLQIRQRLANGTKLPAGRCMRCVNDPQRVKPAGWAASIECNNQH